jgi:ubiquinol-cytochrome c reductase cytochrome c1 subunit
MFLRSLRGIPFYSLTLRSSYPEHDERKKMGLKALVLFVALFPLALYWKRFKWSYVKSRRVVYNPKATKDI